VAGGAAGEPGADVRRTGGKKGGTVARLGILSGTILLQKTSFFGGLKKTNVATDFGEVSLFLSPRAAFIPRHGTDPKHHILPHRINHQANLLALRQSGVREVIAVNSTGSLKRYLPPGTLVVPDDFLDLTGGPTIFEDRPVHVTPVISQRVRKNWIDAARRCAFDVVNGGVYWQTRGPRLETRAEITMMSQFADVVGMTMASEAVIARELGLDYGSLCSVDNYAHGIGERELTMEEILEHARMNEGKIVKILETYMEGRNP